MTETTRRGIYVPLDVNYRDDPKVLGVDPDAELVYLRSLVLAKRLTERDGHIHHAHLHGLADDVGTVRSGECVPRDIAGQLVASGLWVEEGDGWRIPAWLKHNPSCAELDETRNAAATRKANWRKEKRDAEAGEARRDEMSHGTRRDATRREEKRREEKGTEEKRTNPPVELVVVDASPPATRSPVEAVFTAWQEATGHRKAVLDKKRRSRITQALREYPVDDLTDACRGVRLSPHHRGENDTRTVYDDLELVLRDSAHIEKFRDLARGDGGPVAAKLPQNSESIRRAVAAAEGVQ